MESGRSRAAATESACRFALRFVHNNLHRLTVEQLYPPATDRSIVAGACRSAQAFLPRARPATSAGVRRLEGCTIRTSEAIVLITGVHGSGGKSGRRVRKPS